MTNPKENTDLRELEEEVGDILEMVIDCYSEYTDPDKPKLMWGEAVKELLSLINKQRQEAVEKCERICEAEQEKLHQSLMRFANEQYQKGHQDGIAMGKELESKEESNG